MYFQELQSLIKACRNTKDFVTEYNVYLSRMSQIMTCKTTLAQSMWYYEFQTGSWNELHLPCAPVRGKAVEDGWMEFNSYFQTVL